MTENLKNQKKKLVRWYDNQHRSLIFQANAEFYRLVRSLGKGNYLDVACGVGYVFIFGEGVGCDFSSVAVKHCKAHYKTSDFIQCDSHFLPFNNGSFDSISCLGSLEHFDHPKQALMEMIRILKDNGTLIISLPNKHRWTISLSRFGIALNCSLQKQPIDVQYSQKDLFKMFNNMGLRCNKIINPHQFDFKSYKLPQFFIYLANFIDSHIPPLMAIEPLYLFKKNSLKR